MWMRETIAGSLAWGHNTAMKLTYDDKEFALIGEFGSATYPLDELQQWLAYYQRAQEKFPQYAHNYAPSIAAMEQLAEKLGA